MSKFHFSTLVSRTHVFKLQPLIQSLHESCSDFHLYVLCVDPKAYELLQYPEWEHVTLVQLYEVETPELLEAKNNRTFHEYCWTLKPAFLFHVMTNWDDAEYFAHMDTDLFFFSDPELIFAENPNASLFLTDHNNSKRFMSYYERTGRFNTGFVGTRNVREAYEAVWQWRQECISYCTVDMDAERKTYGDQRYVEKWPEQFEHVHIIKSIGVNTALWNIEKYKVSKRNGKVYVNESPLIFYHFSGLTLVTENEFNLCWFYHIDDENTVDLIYMPYILQLKKWIDDIQSAFPDFADGFIPKHAVPDTHFIQLD
ncbi:MULTISPECIES: hypothetical protein [Bacillus]|uniref:hypothetical protein n=1 Tax=Bacillus sp. SKDU12 TaxID=1337053 RepID=UPI0013896D12|nr:hypothetical protein BTW01_10930 [Bacillus sp. SKDU12]